MLAPLAGRTGTGTILLSPSLRRPSSPLTPLPLHIRRTYSRTPHRPPARSPPPCIVADAQVADIDSCRISPLPQAPALRWRWHWVVANIADLSISPFHAARRRRVCAVTGARCTTRWRHRCRYIPALPLLPPPSSPTTHHHITSDSRITHRSRHRIAAGRRSPPAIGYNLLPDLLLLASTSNLIFAAMLLLHYQFADRSCIFIGYFHHYSINRICCWQYLLLLSQIHHQRAVNATRTSTRRNTPAPIIRTVNCVITIVRLIRALLHRQPSPFTQYIACTNRIRHQSVVIGRYRSPTGSHRNLQPHTKQAATALARARGQYIGHHRPLRYTGLTPSVHPTALRNRRAQQYRDRSAHRALIPIRTIVIYRY